MRDLFVYLTQQDMRQRNHVAGQPVTLPHYNFHTGSREEGQTFSLGQDQIVLALDDQERLVAGGRGDQELPLVVAQHLRNARWRKMRNPAPTISPITLKLTIVSPAFQERMAMFAVAGDAMLVVALVLLGPPFLSRLADLFRYAPAGAAERVK